MSGADGRERKEAWVSGKKKIDGLGEALRGIVATGQGGL